MPHYGYYLIQDVPETYWYKAYIKNGQLYLLVLNHEDANTTVSIPLTSTDNSVTVTNFTATVVDGVSTKQTVTGTNGVFTATIDPYGATLFKITTDTDLSSFESTVERPNVNAPSGYVGDATTISWDSVLNAEKYHISIYNKATDEEIYSGFTGTNNSYTITLPVGTYYTYVSAYDASENYSSSYAEFAVLDSDMYTESTVVKNGNVHTVNTTIHNILQQCRLIVVGYKDGAVVDIESRYYASQSETFTLEGDIDEIRVMTWNGLLSLVPVCETEILPASEWTIE
ncbi:MAG: hypothetical protein IKB55_01625 [Clostridia bacterium]|nr:hypothetical protein [Clostridia bacterium]